MDVDTMTSMVLSAPVPAQAHVHENSAGLDVKAQWNGYYQSVLHGQLLSASRHLHALSHVLIHSSLALTNEEAPFSSSIENLGAWEMWEFLVQNSVLDTIVQRGLADEPAGLLLVTCKFCATLAGSMPPACFSLDPFRRPLIRLLQTVNVRSEGDVFVRDAVGRIACALCLLIAEHPTRLADLFCQDLQCPPASVLWTLVQCHGTHLDGDPKTAKLVDICVSSLLSLILSLRHPPRGSESGRGDGSGEEESTLKQALGALAMRHWLGATVAERLLRAGDPWLTVPLVTGLKRRLAESVDKTLALRVIQEATLADFVVPAAAHLVCTHGTALSPSEALLSVAKAPEYFFVKDPNTADNGVKEGKKAEVMSLARWKAMMDPLNATLERASGAENWTRVYDELDLAIPAPMTVHALRNEACRQCFVRILRSSAALPDLLLLLREWPLSAAELHTLMLSPNTTITNCPNDAKGRARRTRGDCEAKKEEAEDVAMALVLLWSWQRLALNGLVRLVHHGST